MTLSQARLLRKIEAGYAHSFPSALLGPRELLWASALAMLGLLKWRPAKGIFPDRYVVTTSGSWALGTFDWTADDFDAEARAAA